MSEQQHEETKAESASLTAGPVAPPSSDAAHEPVASSAQQPVHEPAAAPADAETPELAPEHAAAAATPEAEAEARSPVPGNIIVMPSGHRGWADHDAGSESNAGENRQGMFGKRRIAALAAVVVLAVMAGALGGALATAALTRVAVNDTAASSNHALETSVARIDAEILALKAGVEHTSRLGISQFSKTSDRIDKLEKAQAEPAARIARLSETVDKLRATPAAAPVPVAAASAAPKDITGSVSSPAAAAPPKVEVGRLPTVEGWKLRDVANGGALIEGRQGIYEVYAGDPVPGLGRIDAIRRQDGRWVVVTSRGLIVAR